MAKWMTNPKRGRANDPLTGRGEPPSVVLQELKGFEL